MSDLLVHSRSNLDMGMDAALEEVGFVAEDLIARDVLTGGGRSSTPPMSRTNR